MLTSKPIVDLLKSIDPKFARVEGLSAVAQVKERVQFLPAAFVVPMDEGAAANTLDGGAIDQMVTGRFMVVIVVGASNIAADAADDQMEAFTKAVKMALAGWRHPDAIAAAQYEAGRLVSVAPGQVCWGLVFNTKTRLRKT